jgi:hypothetical protein
MHSQVTERLEEVYPRRRFGKLDTYRVKLREAACNNADTGPHCTGKLEALQLDTQTSTHSPRSMRGAAKVAKAAPTTALPTALTAYPRAWHHDS